MKASYKLANKIKGTNITADTVAGLGRIKKIYGTESGLAKDINLINNIATTKTINGITFTKNSDGTVVADGTATANSTFTLDNFMFIKDEVYTMTNGLNDNAYNKYSLFIPSYTYWGENTFITDSYETFIPKTTIELAVQIIVYAGQTMNNVKFYPKLQKGTVATKWSPYNHGTIEIISKNGEQQSSNVVYVDKQLYAIENVRDELDYDKREISYKFEKIILDGSQNIGYTEAFGSDYTRFDITAPIKPKAAIGMSNKLRVASTGALSGEYIGLNPSYKNIFLYLKNSKLESVDAAGAKKYLQKNPIELIYYRETYVEKNINCSNKIVQYANSTTVYNTNGAEIEVSLTNNKAIAEVNENIDEIEKKINTIDILTAELKEDVTVNATTDKSSVVVLQQASKIGDKLSVTTDGGIKIGQSVKHILVSANARLSSNTANKRASIQPSRNLENVSSRFKHISANGFVCAVANKNYGNSISSTLIDVQENDVIYLQIYTEAGANYVLSKLFCNLTVQVVD